MIHEASSMAWGTADEMRRTAAMLDQTNSDIAAMYAQRTGGSVEHWRAAVAAETWYTAAQAVAAGLADELVSLPARVPELPDVLAARADISNPDLSTPETPAPTADAVPPVALPTAGLDLAELIRTAVSPAARRDTPA
jgi:ClpP class serine protease